MVLQFVSDEDEVVQVLRLPPRWCWNNEVRFALYNSTRQKWFRPSRRIPGTGTKWSPYWKDLPGRLATMNNVANSDDDEDESTSSEDRWYNPHDATNFSYWYLVGEKDKEVFEYLNNLPDANGRSSVMDEWGIFKYE
jgi:hypothetical protein